MTTLVRGVREPLRMCASGRKCVCVCEWMCPCVSVRVCGHACCIRVI